MKMKNSFEVTPVRNPSPAREGVAKGGARERGRGEGMHWDKDSLSLSFVSHCVRCVLFLTTAPMLVPSPQPLSRERERGFLKTDLL